MNELQCFGCSNYTLFYTKKDLKRQGWVYRKFGLNHNHWFCNLKCSIYSFKAIDIESWCIHLLHKKRRKLNLIMGIIFIVITLLGFIYASIQRI